MSLSSSKYMYVQKEVKRGVVKWKLNYPTHAKKRYDTERQAAIAIDKILISQGKPPVNILKKINNEAKNTIPQLPSSD